MKQSPNMGAGVNATFEKKKSVSILTLRANFVDYDEYRRRKSINNSFVALRKDYLF